MKRLKDEKGSALAYVLVVLVVSSVLVGGIITVAQSENYQAIYQHKYTKAYYIARAGAESMAQVMMQMDAQYLNEFVVQQEIQEISNALGTGGNLNVSVVEDDDISTPYMEYKVTGEGTYQGVKASVKIILTYGEYNYAEYSSFSLEDMTDKNDNTVNIGNLLGILASAGEVIEPNNPADPNQFQDYVSITPPVPKHPNISELGGDSFEDLYLSSLSEIEISNTGEDLIIIDSTLIRYTGSNPNKNIIDSITINSGALDEVIGDYYYMKDYNVSTGLFNLTNNSADSDKPDNPIVVIYLEDYFVINKINVNGEKPVIFVVKDAMHMEGSLFINTDVSVLIFMDGVGGTSPELLFSKNNSFIGKFSIFDGLSESDKESYGFPASANSQEELLTLYNTLGPMYTNLNINSTKAVTLEINTNIVIAADIILPNGTFDVNNGQSFILGTSFAKKVIINSSADIMQPVDGGEGTFFSQDEMHISYWLD